MAALTSENVRIHLLGQVGFAGTLLCKTGLHIGGSDESLQIGGVDNFVVKNERTNEPYIPGSSLKGKMRSLLEKDVPALPANRKGADNVWRHECDEANAAIACRVCRLMGATSQSADQLNFPALLRLEDLPAADYTLEIKSENTLDRLSAHANPRTNERVTAGSTFSFSCTYDVQLVTDAAGALLLGNANPATEAHAWQLLADDLHHVLDALLLVEASALGGHGSRGYGRVAFDDVTLTARTVSEIVGRPAPAEAALPAEVQTNGRTDRFSDARAQIPAFLRRFNGVFAEAKRAMRNGAAAPSNEPSTGAPEGS